MLRTLLLISCGLYSGSLTFGQDSGLSPAHVSELQQVLDVFPSPAGDAVAFTRLVQRSLSNGAGPAYVHLYAVELEEGASPRLLIGGKKRVRGVSWSPDGRAIHFIAAGEGDPHPEVHALPMDGGEPRRITRTPHGVLSFKWAPKGRFLAYTARDPAPPQRARARKLGFQHRVVDEDWARTSLHLWDDRQKTTKRLSTQHSVNSYEWSPDGTRLAVGMAPRGLIDDRYMFTRLWAIHPFEGRHSKIVDNPGKLGAYAWSPDGARLAYVSAQDRRDPHAGMLFLKNGERQTPRPLSEGLRGMVHDVHWKDANTILATVSIGVRSQIRAFDARTGQSSVVMEGGDVAFQAFKPCAANGAIFAVGSTSSHPDEVYVLSKDGHRRITNSNPWLDRVALGKQEVVRFKARDGLEIEGLLIHPLGRQEGQRHPLVIIAHGGPESHFLAGWNTSYSNWGQMLSARGYFAWLPNYRSSTGYGVEFAKSDHGDPMGAEFNDHLDAIQMLAERGLIDKARVGLGGGSYGGYTAAWAATKHSEHFAAAVSFVPFVDIRTKWYCSDIPLEFYYVHYQEKWPHEQRAFLDSRSPLAFVSACRTPLLISGGTADTRVHPSQPFMLYRAVKFATKTPVRYVQYPGEGHGNRQNVYRFDYCVRSIRWFDHYLKPGDHRLDPPPPMDIDYETWLPGKAAKEGSGDGR